VSFNTSSPMVLLALLVTCGGKVSGPTIESANQDGDAASDSSVLADDGAIPCAELRPTNDECLACAQGWECNSYASPFPNCPENLKNAAGCDYTVKCFLCGSGGTGHIWQCGGLVEESSAYSCVP
jgi:hypothetical protein